MYIMGIDDPYLFDIFLFDFLGKVFLPRARTRQRAKMFELPKDPSCRFAVISF